MPEPRIFALADLRAGLKADFERDVTIEDIQSFARLSGDSNPLHLDEAYGRQTNYGTRIVHGAFQVAWASAMAGMYLPGRDVVVSNFQCRFPVPLPYPARVRVQGEITTWVPRSLSGILRVQVIEIRHSALTAEIHVGFALHETPAESRGISSPEAAARISARDAKPLLMITGGGGGLGRYLVSTFADSYDVIGVVRSPAQIPESSPPGVEWEAADLTAPGWEEGLAKSSGGRKLYGIVHAAWPTAPKGSLLDVEADAVARQVEFGSLATIRLARFLKQQAGDAARLVLLGTTAASIKPIPNQSAYSLGKVVLEHTVRLLAPELALRNITVNLVTPSMVPIGMNSGKAGKVFLSEAAKVPLGRLCSPEDVARSVEFFLSAGAAFVTGQNLPLSGGQI